MNACTYLQIINKLPSVLKRVLHQLTRLRSPHQRPRIHETSNGQIPQIPLHRHEN